MPLDIPASLFATREPQTQSGDSGYAAFVEGQRGARQNRELRLKEDEQAAMLPIQAEQARLAVNSQLLDINLKRNQLERDNQIKAGQSEALQIMLDAGGFEDGYLNPAITQRLHRLAVTNPAVFMSPSGQSLLNNWRGAQVTSQAITKAGMTGLPLRSITTDEAGKSVTTFEDPSFRFDPLAQEKLDLRRRGLDQADVRSQLNALGLTLRATNEGYLIENMPGLTVPSLPGQPPATGNQPDTATQEWLGPGNVTTTQPTRPTLTPIARPLTTANVTAGQKDLQAADSAISSIGKSRAALAKNPDAAGFAGYLKEIYEGLGGQLGLNPGTRITGTRTELRDTANQLVTGLRVEVGQMSDWERKLIDSITDPLDKLASAAVIDTRLAIVERLIAGRALRRNRDMHVNPSHIVLSALADQDLVDAVNQGYLNQQHGLAEVRRREQARKK